MARGILTLSAAALLVGVSSQAMAGGLERGGYNIDQLFDQSRFSFGGTGTYVMPQRELNNVQDTDFSDGVGSNGVGGGATDGVEETESYFVPRLGVKAGLFEDADCLVQYSQPWGAHTNPGPDWRGANSNIETEIESDSYELTCSYSFDVGPGEFRIIGGGFHQELSGFKERLVFPAGAPGIVGSGVGRLDLSTEGQGYRVGAAYEMPEIALRASLVYNSAVELEDITGTLDLSEVNGAVIPVYGQAEMPQSVELKLQSGIAPGWLAFGSVKWVDWSVLQTIPFCAAADPRACVTGSGADITSLDLLYRDGWTVSAGVGHRFNEKLSGLASLTWDRGTSTGLGSQTDTWSVSGGVAYTPTEMVELQFGGALGVLTSGSSGAVTTEDGTFGDDVSYDFDDDFVGALQAGLKIRF
jgi:long-chain fatty acid transport protein